MACMSLCGCPKKTDTPGIHRCAEMAAFAVSLAGWLSRVFPLVSAMSWSAGFCSTYNDRLCLGFFVSILMALLVFHTCSIWVFTSPWTCLILPYKPLTYTVFMHAVQCWELFLVLECVQTNFLCWFLFCSCWYLRLFLSHFPVISYGQF